MLKALAEISPYTTPQDSRQILPNVVQLLKVLMLFKMTVQRWVHVFRIATVLYISTPSSLMKLIFVHSHWEFLLFLSLWIICLSQSNNMFLVPFQKYMPRRKTGEEMNFTYVECLLYTFHHLAHKVVGCNDSSLYKSPSVSLLHNTYLIFVIL